MEETINPQFPYYVLLFSLTVILRFIRAYRSRPTDEGLKNADTRKMYLARYWFFGFELVNVSAGVFILLSENVTKFVASVMMTYVILVVLSFFFEEEGVHVRIRTVGHIMVSLAVFVVLFFAFFYVPGLKKPQEATSVQRQENEEANPTWKVALPYVDSTMNRNFGVKDKLMISSYVLEVTAKNRSEALAAAKKKFRSEDGPAPFVKNAEKSEANLWLQESDAVIEMVFDVGGAK